MQTDVHSYDVSSIYGLDFAGSIDVKLMLGEFVMALLGSNKSIISDNIVVEDIIFKIAEKDERNVNKVSIKIADNPA